MPIRVYTRFIFDPFFIQPHLGIYLYYGSSDNNYIENFCLYQIGTGIKAGFYIFSWLGIYVEYTCVIPVDYSFFNNPEYSFILNNLGFGLFCRIF